jgi:hypothetical protein
MKFNEDNGDMFVHTSYPWWHDLFNKANGKRPDTLEEERPPPASFGYCECCAREVESCCSYEKPCDRHRNASCESCAVQRRKYCRLPSITRRVIAIGAKNYEITDEEGVVVKNRGTMKAQRKRAAEDGAYEKWLDTGEGYRIKQPRLGHTSITHIRQRQENARDMELDEPSAELITGVMSAGDNDLRTVISEAGGEKGWLVRDGDRRHYLPFGHYAARL